MNSPQPPTPEDLALRKLAALGADRLNHINGDLSLHLKGTCELLRQWGAPHDVCMAGLYHAVYGTAGFADQLLGLERRADIAAVIGERAEHLVYLFSACDRKDFYSRLYRREAPLFRDRFSGETALLAPDVLAPLCELTLANELEILLKASPLVRQRAAPFMAGLLQALGPHAGGQSRLAVRAWLDALAVSPPGGSSPPAPSSSTP